MADKSENIDRLRSRLEALIRRHGEIAVEMYKIREELDSLTSAPSAGPKPETVPEQETRGPDTVPIPKDQYKASEVPSFQTGASSLESFAVQAKGIRLPSNLERWIGENLISKIGIAITILGVAIGAKYAIDKGWITPVMRVVFGYLVGISLLLAAYRTRDRYQRFSGVLLSGAMAIFYFISFAAYSYYGLVPQAFSFVLMTGFTVFTVIAALRYDRVLIAHIGLIGAYAVPFLLSEGSDRFAFLFTYVAIINTGILAVSVARYWRSLFYPSFLLTWAIYGFWYAANYEPAVHLNLALAFAFVFFAIFYATFITYKLVQGTQFVAENVLLILANAFIFYGFTYGIASGNATLEGYLGPVTLANGAIHLAVAVSVFRFAAADRTVISLLAALVITFVTIAIPVQLDGDRVTLLWIAEAAALFMIARYRSIPLFEYFAYSIVFIGVAALFAGWDESMRNGIERPLFNSGFLTGSFFAAGLGLILWIDSKQELRGLVPTSLADPMRAILAGVLIFVVYNALRLEIANFWRQEMLVSAELVRGSTYPWDAGHDPYPPLMNFIWQINYSMAFTAGIWYVNERYLRKASIRAVSAVSGVFWLLLFLVAGLTVLGSLREAYLLVAPDVPSHGAGSIAVRYASYACAGAVLFILSRCRRSAEFEEKIGAMPLEVAFDLLLNLSVLSVLSAELITWMDIGGIADSGKLALSILWGLYAVALLLVGIRSDKRHLRIGAIALFTGTLFKVFIYDLSDLGTVSRTVVFVSLGVLLLIASYLYSKYGKVIFGDDEA